MTTPMVKVTVLLSKNALSDLDEMTKNTGTGSRGRTVELLIRTVHECQKEVQDLAKSMRQIPPPAATPRDEAYYQAYVDRAVLQSLTAAPIVGRLSRFYPRVESQ